MRVLVALVLVAWLSGCGGRVLTEGERALAADLFGDGLDVGRVRVARMGDAPATPPDPPVKVTSIEARPGVCDRTAPDPGPRGPPPAIALYDRMSVAAEWYRDDMMPGWPRQVLIPEALIMAHELVHVWQWQNRRLTGYHPVRAALESVLRRDPYFYAPAPGGGFLEYGYEQQAALVEDYMCYLLYDPANPRRAELRRTLAPYLTVDRLERALRRQSTQD